MGGQPMRDCRLQTVAVVVASTSASGFWSTLL